MTLSFGGALRISRLLRQGREIRNVTMIMKADRALKKGAGFHFAPKWMHSLREMRPESDAHRRRRLMLLLFLSAPRTPWRSGTFTRALYGDATPLTIFEPAARRPLGRWAGTLWTPTTLRRPASVPVSRSRSAGQAAVTLSLKNKNKSKKHYTLLNIRLFFSKIIFHFKCAFVFLSYLSNESVSEQCAQ